MIVDGKAIAADILRDVKREVERMGRTPRLAVFTCAPTFETQKFLSIKKKRAAEAGITVDVVELPPESTTDDVLARVAQAAKDADGIVVQLPFPRHIDTEAVIEAIPSTHDIDALGSGTTAVLPPVTAAVEEILKHNDVSVAGKHAVVVGAGRLVGRPTAAWLEREGAEVAVVTKDEASLAEKTGKADIIVLGAGVPGLLKPSDIKRGTIILDAGTSEAAGVLAGDADPACAEKASLFTPVPGGIGPITIAVLLRNLVTLAQNGI